MLPKQDAVDRVDLGRRQWSQTTDGYFSHSSGSWKFKLKVLICLVSGEGPLLLAYGWHPLIVFQRRIIPDVFLFQIYQFYQIRANPMTLFKCIYYQEGTISNTVVPRYPWGLVPGFPLDPRTFGCSNSLHKMVQWFHKTDANSSSHLKPSLDYSSDLRLCK